MSPLKSIYELILVKLIQKYDEHEQFQDFEQSFYFSPDIQMNLKNCKIINFFAFISKLEIINKNKNTTRKVATLPFIASRSTDSILPQCSPTLSKKRSNSQERKLSKRTLRNCDIDSEV